ncbi:glycoside hydrolase family 43 protein [Cellulomonas fimi]|uniref:glycoside hydrolase family 43 protein n=1 Tax=Cellulomonas sp. RIT-PI-Y TaxID=3035297 RepID=UPI0021DA12FF
MRVANPVLAGCYPDPSVCRVGEWFYVVNSTFEYLPGLPVHRSRDLVHWEPVGHAVTDRLDLAGVGSSRGLYAPTLRHHDGRFWLVCTAVDAGGHFLLTAEDAAGPWSAPMWLAGEGIDPSLFVDDDGRVWFHATRPAADPEWDGQTEIWLRELVDGALVGPEHVLWTGAVRGAVWSEGPHLYRIDGQYYLLTAEGGTEFHHAVVVARADRVTGPYLGDPANPVLTHRHLGRDVDVAAVGHADLVQAVDGSWWALLLGVRPYGGFHHNLGRETFLVPVTWQDGWPVFAPGEGRVPREVEVPFAASAPAASARTDFGISAVSSVARVPNSPPLYRTDAAGAVPVSDGPAVVPADDPAWCAPRHLPTDLATPDGDDWLLPARTTTLADTEPSSFLGVRQRHQDCEVVVSVAAGLAPGTWAGLAVRQSETDHLTLLTDGTVTRAVLVRAGEPEELGAGPAGNTLVLRTRGQEYALLSGPDLDHLSEIAVADGRDLDSVAAGGFLGLWIGPYVTATTTATATKTATVRGDTAGRAPAGQPAPSTVRVRLSYRPLSTAR